MNLAKLLTLSVPQFIICKSEKNHITSHGLMWEFNEVINVKYLAECLANIKRSINDNYDYPLDHIASQTHSVKLSKLL